MINTSINKNYYKIFLIIVKYIPNILALMKMSGLILSYFHISTFSLTCISGTSLIFLMLLYLISYIFQFCGTHRVSLNYVTSVTLLTIIDFYIGIPLKVDSLYRLYTIITGVFITSWIIIWYKNRHNLNIVEELGEEDTAELLRIFRRFAGIYSVQQ